MVVVLLLSYFIIAALVVGWVISMFRSYDEFHLQASRQMVHHPDLKRH
jgi:flagellar biosynthesis protein FliQ